MMKQTKLNPVDELNPTGRKSNRLETKVKRKLDEVSEPPEEVARIIKKTKHKKSSLKDGQTTLFAILLKKEEAVNEKETSTLKKTSDEKDVDGKGKKILSTKREVQSSIIAIKKKGKNSTENGKDSITNIVVKTVNSSKPVDQEDDIVFIDFEVKTKSKISLKRGIQKGEKETSSYRVDETESVWTCSIPTPSIWNEDIFIHGDLPNHVQCLPIASESPHPQIPFKYNNFSLDTPVFKKNGSFIKISNERCLKTEIKRNVELDSNLTTDNGNILWTDSFKPSKASEVIGNSINIEFLASWLLEWKNKRAACDDESSCSSYAWSDINDEMIRCVLITGATGVGKTSLVYALAQEYKFKIFEVNASSTRGSKQIIGQLQEATQSHHVEGSASNALTRFLIKNDVSSKDKGEKLNAKETMPVKVKKQRGRPAKNVVEKPKGIMAYFNKNPSEECVPEVDEVEKPKLNSIKNWLKIVDKKMEKVCEAKTTDTSRKLSQKKSEKVCEAKAMDTSEKLSRKKSEKLAEDLGKTETSTSPDENQEGLKFSSSSIILFDDVDIVFDEDEGFWSSVNNFIKTTKKPVILTASRSSDFVMGCVNSNFETLNLDITINQCTKFLRKICQDRQLGYGKDDLKLITRYFRKDIRKVLLELQFWADNKNQQGNIANFKSPVVKYCLNKNLREGVFNFLLNSDYEDSFQCLEVFKSEGYFPLHANVENWLPLPKKDLNQIQEEENIIKPEKNLADISWISEDGIETKGEELKKELLKKEPLVRASLEKLSSLFDNYSDLDQGFCVNKELYYRYKSYNNEPNNLSIEIASWREIAFCKIAKRDLTTTLENHTGDINESVHLIESEFCIEKFDSFDENISNAINLISATVIPVQHVNGALEKIEYVSALKVMNESETIRHEIKSTRTRRFHHYFDANSLIVDEDAIKFLSRMLK